jgi:hypothetical protein
MAFRPTPTLAAGIFVAAGFFVALACNQLPDEQLGNVGQLCFEGPDGVLSCDPGLTCVPLPLDGGGTDGGQCFDLEAGDESTVPADDALEDAVTTDDAGEDASEGGEGGSDVQEAATDAPPDSPATEAGMDARAD